MKVSVVNWQGQNIKEIELREDVFCVPMREDILSRVVLWQLARRRSGNHQTKEIGDISGTTRKPYRQKGTGRARQGSLRSPQFRKGAVIFGPHVRDHGYDLPKKIRKLGLKTALSSRLSSNSLIVMDNLQLQSEKTKAFLSCTSYRSVLMIDGERVCGNLKKAVSNLYKIDLLPRQGINVYDILNHDHLILSEDAALHLNNWLAN